ncbi:MAG: hypothetical protein D3922_09225, partial [Candidatus Electrothrix sp. AR1]|nr:hypothetical protein [Candidatus Electrothrix sp. AR1]
MKHSLLILYAIGIIIISGCHHEPLVPEKNIPSGPSSPADDVTNKWALVIGINDYSKQNKIPELKLKKKQLNYAVNDALAVKIRLEDMGFKVKPLLDEEATETEIFKQFKKYDRIIGPNDQLVIFYAGHGYTDNGEGYIVSSDGEKISFDEIRKETFNLPPKHILYIFDSCHSGFLDPAVQTKWPKRRRKKASYGKEERKLRQAVYTLTAGSSEEETEENPTKWKGHSYFTLYLLKGLDGVADIDNNCKITASELGVYLTQIIRSLNDKTPQEQHPLFNRVSGEGEIAFPSPRCQEEVVRQQQLDPDKKWATSDAYKGWPSTYSEPTQLLVDRQNNLYVLDTSAQMVYKFDSEGKHSQSYSHKNWVPTSMALNNNSSLWVYYSSGERGEVVIYE